MAFLLFLSYLGLTLLRPGEHVASLGEWPVMSIASGLAVGAAVVAVLLGRAPSFRAPQIPIVLALSAWFVVSLVANATDADVARYHFLGFVKSSGTAFLLVVLNVLTTRRMRFVAMALSLFAAVVVIQAGALNFAGSSALSGAARTLDPASNLGSPDSAATTSTRSEATRLAGVGLFRDPNDFGVTLIAILPLTFALYRIRRPVQNALLVWLPAGLMLYGIYLTRSRGGLLALACVLGLSVRRRAGTAVALTAAAAALVAFLALGFLGGRSIERDQSAMGRIVAWSEGLQMLKSSPVAGVGFRQFTVHHDRVAHNSFVHCLAELGLVGYLLWLSLVVFTLDDTWALARLHPEVDPDLARFANAVSTSLIGFLVGGIFLSRSYDVILFLLLGLGTALGDIPRRDGLPTESRGLLQRITLVGGVAMGSIIAVWLYMRLLR
jgi:O-antigen ligase